MTKVWRSMFVTFWMDIRKGAPEYTTGVGVSHSKGNLQTHTCITLIKEPHVALEPWVANSWSILMLIG